MAEQPKYDFSGLDEVSQETPKQSAYDFSGLDEAPAKPDYGDVAKMAGKSIVTGGFSAPAFAGGEAISDYLSDLGQGAIERLRGIPTQDVHQTKDLSQYKDVYLNRLKQEMAEDAAIKKEFPISGRVAEASGAILPGLVTGAGTLGIKESGKLAAKEALAQGLTREAAAAASRKAILGNLIESGAESLAYGGAQMIAQHPRSMLEGTEAREEISSDVLKAAPLLFAAGPVFKAGTEGLGELIGAGAAKLKGARQISNEVSDSPLISQTQKAFQAGKQGEGFSGSSSVLEREVGKKKSAVDQIMNYFNEKEKVLLDQKDFLLKEAVESGAVVPPSSELPLFKGTFEVHGMQEIGGRPFQNAAQKLEEYRRQGLSPVEAEKLRGELYQLLTKARSPQLRDSIINLRNELQSGLNKTVDGLEGLNSEISSFLQAGKQKFFPGQKLPNAREVQNVKLGNKVERLLENLRGRGPGSEDAQKVASELQSGLGKFVQESPEAAEKLGVNPQDLINMLRNKSDEVIMSQKLRGLAPTAQGAKIPLIGLGNKGLGLSIPVGLPGEKTILGAANIAGKVVGYTTKSAEKVASILPKMPGKTEAKKTAALFSLLQQNTKIRKEMNFSEDQKYEREE